MDLDAVTVAIRPRNSWESIDAGFLLARRWYWRLLLLWLLPAIPFLFLLFAGAFFLTPPITKWFILLFWLMKPFYELPILNWVSKVLFGEKASIGGTLKEVRKKLGFRTVLTLLFTRFSPFRSFSLPVLHLEGMEGKSRKERLSLLAHNSETAFFLTTSGFCIELFLTFSIMAIFFWLLPENLRWMNFGRFMFRPDNWILLVSYLLSCAVFAPFYTCAGFMMYISRRVELEAWDIEIGFKRIEQRLSRLKNGIVRTTSAVILLLAITLAALPGEISAASPDPQKARNTIANVLEKKEFGHKITKYYWAPKEKETPQEEKSPWVEWWAEAIKYLVDFFSNILPFLAQYGKFLLCFGAGIVIIYLLLKYTRLRDWLGGRSNIRRRIYTPPEIMFGMDLRPESLPDDIGASCLELLEKGRKRDALSLLYRGTLSRMVNLHNLEIHSSFTEAECCDEVRGHRPAAEGTFFDDLTGLWVFLAYGHRNADEGICRRLIHEWDKLYGAQP